jgi:hypothetical protein
LWQAARSALLPEGEICHQDQQQALVAATTRPLQVRRGGREKKGGSVRLAFLVVLTHRLHHRIVRRN